MLSARLCSALMQICLLLSSPSSSNSEYIGGKGKWICIFHFNQKWGRLRYYSNVALWQGVPWPGEPGWPIMFESSWGDRWAGQATSPVVLWHENTRTERSVLLTSGIWRFCLPNSVCPRASSCACDVVFLCCWSQGFIFTLSVSLVFIQMCTTAHALLIFSLSWLKLLHFSLS